MKTEEIKQWALSVIDASSFEFDTLLAKIPPGQRDVIGELKKWSPKDQIAHLIFWIDLFATNLKACRKGSPLISTADYLAMNDVAWLERKDWTWLDIETNLARIFSDIRAQIQDSSSEQLTDAHRYSLGTSEAEPEPILQSLVYELIKHPVHHFVIMYRIFGDRVEIDSLFARTMQMTNQPDVLIWSEPTVKTIQELIEQNRTTQS
jgi:hypothetical protein